MSILKGMKTDLYTRVLLYIIGICLIFNVLKVVGFIPDIYADSSPKIVSPANLLNANEDGSLNVRLRASDVIKIEPASGARFTIEPSSSAEFKIKPVSGADFIIKPNSYTNFRIYNTQSDALYVKSGSNVAFNIKQSGQSTHVPVTGVSLEYNSMKMEIDGNYKMKANVFPWNASDNSVNWHSSNPSVATIDAQGNVKAVTMGTSTIQVTTVDGGFSATCVVEVEGKRLLFNYTEYPFNSGTISGNGAGFYDVGSTITVKAIPNTGYKFMCWLLNGDTVSVNTDYTFTLTSKTFLSAIFSLIKTHVTLAATASPTNGGEVKGGGIYALGETTSFSAKPNKGYVFKHWEVDGKITYTGTYFMHQAIADVAFVAVFEKRDPGVVDPPKIPVTLTVNASPADGGEVKGSGSYVSGTLVPLVAKANQGYVFKYWELDGIILYDGTYFMHEAITDVAFVAVFEKKDPGVVDPPKTPVTLTVNASPADGGEVKGSGSYASGTLVPLIAKANQGYVFKYWELGGIILYDGTPFIYQAIRDAELNAVFEKKDANAAEQFSVSLNITAYGGILTIQSDKELGTVTVHAINGLCLYRNEVNSSEVKISGLPKGVLIVTIGGQTRKVVMY